MKRKIVNHFKGILLLIIISHSACWSQAVVSQQGRTLFDSEWKFHRGGAQGAEMPVFDDSKWRNLDLPHDWSIENIPGTSSPFDPDAIGQVSTGFTEGGTGWYRKSFTPPDIDGKLVFIQFDGVYMNADVWVNGNHLGNHPYGYTSFWYEISEHLKSDEENVISVQVKNEGQNSRWYTGSGIYRHVWLKIVSPLYIEPWGTYITTPEVTDALAKVQVKTKVRNVSGEDIPLVLVTRIVNSKGAEVASVKTPYKIKHREQFEFSQQLEIKTPEKWSVDSPVLYTAVSGFEVFDRPMGDIEETKFGVRTISFDAVKGFQLNGKSLELKGGCVHHDNGPLGARAYDRAEERRVELLKASGYNAIRCAHNPPSPAFLDACDRLGMLVIDEAFDMWVNPNNPHDYHLFFDKWWQRDVESMILRDRNHPSIILWSIGNEIRGMETPEVVEVAKKLSAFIHELEPTRPVTAAVNGVNEKKDPFFSTLDVAGYNYSRDQYAKDHERHPERIMYCTESYPLETFEYWQEVKNKPWVIGDFVWTSFDYIGEASIGWRGYYQKQNFYPWTLAFCGDIDICGEKRPQSYYRDVVWNNNNDVSIFIKPPQPSFPVNPEREFWSIWHWNDAVADWNWSGQEGKPIEVNVYSSCESVELFVNGKSLGKKPTNTSTKFIATWNVRYQSGELTAVGFVGKKKVKTTVLKTTTAATSIKLTADKSTISADGQSLSYISVELVDSKGLRNPKAENTIKFDINGPGTIVAVANANPMSVESFQEKERKAWQGKALVIIKSDKTGGEIKLSASSEGLQSAVVTIQSK